MAGRGHGPLYGRAAFWSRAWPAPTPIRVERHTRDVRIRTVQERAKAATGKRARIGSQCRSGPCPRPARPAPDASRTESPPDCRSGPCPRPVRAPASDPGAGARHASDPNARPHRTARHHLVQRSSRCGFIESTRRSRRSRLQWRIWRARREAASASRSTS